MSRLLLLLVILGLCGCKPASSQGTSEDERSPWEVLAPGMEGRSWSPAKGVEARAIKLDPARWSLRSALARELPPTPDSPDPATLTARLFVQRTGAALAVNGGFFDPELRPMGLRISEGVEKVRHRKADWGVFSIQSGKPSLVHARDWKKGARADFAIECGPRLVNAGKAVKLKPNRFRRTVIGHTPRGEVVIVITRHPIDLNVLAAGLVRGEEAGGLGLYAALNLDGGPSTQLHLPADPGYDMTGVTGVADAVLAVPR